MTSATQRSRRGTVVLAFVAVSMAGAAFAAQAAPDARVADAAAQRDVAAVRALLRGGSVDVNAPQPDGSTALLWAAHHDDVDMADQLIRAGARVSARNRFGLEPVFEAARNGSVAMIERLLNAGADANATMYEGNTVLMVASRTGNAAAVKILLARGARVDAREGWHGETALMWAAAEDHADVVKVLAEAGADVNATTTRLEWLDEVQTELIATQRSRYPSGGLTPLIHAVRDNAYEAAKALLEAGANPNLATPPVRIPGASPFSDGLTPLIIATANAHWDMANLLIEKGADVNDGSIVQTASMIVYGNMVRAHSPRPDALDGIDVLKALLKHGAKPDGRITVVMPEEKPTSPGNDLTGMTAFYRASIAANLTMMQILGEAGADGNFVSSDGSTPLMAAASLGAQTAIGGGPIPATEEQRVAAIRFCLDRGADVNALDGRGMTALHRAADRGFDTVVQYLAERGAKLDIKDQDGRTALDVANGVPRRGADVDTPPPVRVSTGTLLRKLMGIAGGSEPDVQKSVQTVAETR